MGISTRTRLRTARQFQRVFTAGRRCSDRCFTVLARRNGGLPARLGLAIGKKYLPRAVDRNRIKRIIRESFRLSAGRLDGLDIVVIARRDVAGAPNPRIRGSIDALWRRIAQGSGKPA